MIKEEAKREKIKYQKVDIAIPFAKSLVAKDKKYYVSNKMPGLCLKVQPTGHKSWIYYYRAKGRLARSMKLGDFETASPV